MKIKNLLGTLNELAFKGKVVENVDFHTLKHTGVYNVKNLGGIPSNIPNDKRAILSIISVGNTDNPDVILYRLIGANGVITENTIAGNSESGWGTGGVSLKNTIENINNSIGRLNELRTQAKDVSGAINEVLNKANGIDWNLGQLKKEYASHNHDDRYVLKHGDTLEGNVVVGNNSSFKVMNNGGKQYNFSRLDGSDHMVLGDQAYHISIQSKDGLEVNGHKVFTTENSGEGSGINADLLDGIDGRNFARRDDSNDMYGELNLMDGHTLNIFSRANASGGRDDSTINFMRGTDGRRAGYIRTVGDRLALGLGDREIWSYNQYNSVTNNDIVLNAQRDSEVRMQFGHDGNRIGFYYSNTSRQELGIYDWGKNNWVMTLYKEGRPDLQTPNAPMFQGRRIYLQNNQPGGNIPYGSVWIGF